MMMVEGVTAGALRCSLCSSQPATRGIGGMLYCRTCWQNIESIKAAEISELAKGVALGLLLLCGLSRWRWTP